MTTLFHHFVWNFILQIVFKWWLNLWLFLLSEYICCAPYFISLKEVYLTIFLFHWHYPTSIYLFKLKDRNTRTTLEIRSKLAVKTQVRRQSRRSGVFNVNFEQFSYILEPHCWLWTSKSHVFLYYFYIIGMFSVGDTTWMSCFVGFGSWNNTSSSWRKSWVKRDGRRKQSKDWIFLSSSLEWF